MNKILVILALVAIAGGGFGYYMWNKPHQNMNAADAQVVINAIDLFNAFDSDEQAASKTYLDKIVNIKGKVKSLELDGEVKKVILESSDDFFGVICELDGLSTPKRMDFKVGEEVSFKGICTGKLMDVVMTRCVEL